MASARADAAANAAFLADLRPELENCDASVARARSLPPRAYAAVGMQAIEREKIFSRGWVPLGRTDRVAAPGDYQTLDIAGRPIILLRDKTGALQALANTCRHRGARLLDGAGNTSGIRCPFHAWLYRLDGTLAAAPRMEAAEGFAICDHGLHRYPLAERLRFAFVSFDAAPPDFDRWIGNFEDTHADWPLADMVLTRTWTREFNCDWKGFIDVFNEYYHLPYVHRDSIDGVYGDPDPAEQTSGNYTSQFGATEGTGGLLEYQQEHALPNMPGLRGRAKNGVRYTWVFPSMTFACSTDALWVYEAYPVRPGVCRVTQSTCFHPETMKLDGFTRKAQEYYKRLDTALDEDIPALENQHRGLLSPEARQGPYSPRLEPNVAAFARWYARRLLRVNL